MRSALFVYGFVLLTVGTASAQGDQGPAQARGRDGGVLYVDDDAPPPGNGATWETAFPFLQDAMAASGGGAEVRIAQGTYLPDRNAAGTIPPGTRTVSFLLSESVGLYGGYRGAFDNSGLSPDDRDIDAFTTTLSGEIGAAGTADNSFSVVKTNNTSAATRLDGVTICLGRANGDHLQNQIYGAGIYMIGSDARVHRCTFSGNWAIYGGGIHIDGGDPEITSCVFTGNNGNHSGGGICAFGDSPVVAGCVFLENTTGGYGAGIRSGNMQFTLVNCLFHGNYSWFRGGGLCAEGAAATVADCTFHQNTADDGGGIYNEYGTLHVSNSVIWDNVAPSGPQISSSAAVVRYCCVEGGWVGEGNIGDDPRFLNPSGGDLHLEDDSPCVDAGSDAEVPPGVTVDLDGNPRFMDGDGDGSATVDMGAYEVDATADVPVVAEASSGISVRLLPNPSSGETAILLHAAADGYVQAAIFEPAGRQVCELFEGVLRAGTREFSWDGRDHAGRPMASGVYLVRVCSAVETRVERLLVVR